MIKVKLNACVALSLLLISVSMKFVAEFLRAKLSVKTDGPIHPFENGHYQNAYSDFSGPDIC
jgi:hypothetical protein